MITARLDRLIAEGTDRILRPVLLADGHAFSVNIKAGEDQAAAVVLWPGLDAPDGEAWENEDPWESFLTGGDADVSQFLDVPVAALRDLMEQHGGEAPTGDDDPAGAAPLAMLRAAGLRCVEDNYALSADWHRVRVPLADGTDIVFEGFSARSSETFPDVTTRYPIAEHGWWTASWGEPGSDIRSSVYHSAGQHRPYVDDTAALVGSIVEQARRCGGSAPEEGVGETAEQIARKALAEWGITAYLDDEPLLDGGRNTWLVIPRDQAAGQMSEGPYLVLALYNGDDDEWPMDQRPPVRRGDEWRVDIGDGGGIEKGLMDRPAERLADCIERIAEWVTNPLPTAGSVLLAELAKYGIAAHTDIGLSYAIPVDPATPAAEAFSRAHLSVADRNPSIEHDPAFHTGWTVFVHDEDGTPIGDPRYIAGDGEQPVDCTADSVLCAAYISDWLTAHRP
ncbi:hypothetical protein ACFXC8_13255 [Streptomyces sp. NPDC059441]|uniref:hypothetical protein n=1 Tax=Streptomyces sp. NPDC059441 TaxID=3346829 RepID=UPI00369DDDA4